MPHLAAPWRVAVPTHGDEKHPYYKLMRNAARELGFKKRILWTDLAKCSAADNRKLPVHEHRQEPGPRDDQRALHVEEHAPYVICPRAGTSR
jgi:hypothetical protein